MRSQRQARSVASNWQDALDTLDLELLRAIIQIVTEYERLYGKTISATELRASLRTSSGSR